MTSISIAITSVVLMGVPSFRGATAALHEDNSIGIPTCQPLFEKIFFCPVGTLSAECHRWAFLIWKFAFSVW